MKPRKILMLRKYEDLENFAVQLEGRYHRFKKHRTTEGIYILDMRPRKDYRQLSLDFEKRCY
jgi:hypothetical protein